MQCLSRLFSSSASLLTFSNDSLFPELLLLSFFIEMKSKRSMKKKKDQGAMVFRSENTIAVEVNMGMAITAVEGLLGYKFSNKRLLEEALTHSSHPDSESYQRLEFVGDAALGLVITNHIFLSYPDLEPGHLSVLRSANISTEKLARVAIRYNLYRYLCHNAPALNEKVWEFERAIERGFDEVPYGSVVKAPKVLADIVESIAAAVYVDCGFDLKVLWMVFRGLLEPIVTMETLHRQPVTSLFEFCQKQGKHVDIRYWKKGSKSIACVFVAGKMLASGRSEQKEIAKLIAAKAALEKLLDLELSDDEEGEEVVVGGLEEIDGAKKRLNELCSKSHWPNPLYRVVKETGPPHDRRFVCSVQVNTQGETYVSTGDVKQRIKDAESSAASMMLNALLDRKCCDNG